MCDISIRFKSNGLRITKILVIVDDIQYSLGPEFGLRDDNCQKHKIKKIIEKLIIVDADSRQSISKKLLDSLRRMILDYKQQDSQTFNNLCGIFIYFYIPFERSCPFTYLEDIKKCYDYDDFIECMKHLHPDTPIDTRISFRENQILISSLHEGFKFAMMHHIDTVFNNRSYYQLINNK